MNVIPVAVAIIAGVVMLLGLAACGGVSTTSSRTSTAAPSTMTMPTWWNNCGAPEISGINQDLGTVQQGINYPANSELVADVEQLGADAQSDLTSEPLPPVDASDFTGWLNSLVQIAHAVQNGTPVNIAFQEVDAMNGAAQLRDFQSVVQSYGLALSAGVS